MDTSPTRRRHRFLGVTVLVIAVAFGITACQPAYTGPEGPRTAVVGDSITNSATSELGAELAGVRRFVQGIDSIDLADGRNRLVKPVVSTDPSVVVVELGINSARETWNSADLAELEGALADLKAVPCVVWVTPTAMEASYYDHLGNGTLKTRIALFQASLAKRLPKNPNVHLADFGAIEATHPEWFQADGLHLSGAGRAAYAAYVADQVATHC